MNEESAWSLYDLQGNWLGEYDSAGVPRQQVIWFAGMPVGVIDRRREGAAQEGPRLFYVQADALGTPRAVIDPISTANPWGKAVWRWELTGEAFGADLPIEDPDSDGKRFVFDMRFPGQRFDDATGLHYNYFRDYDPAVGRYVQSDPIGLVGGISTFAYAGSAPSILADPSGLNPAVGLCFAPVVGWGSCAALAGGAILITGCIASGICEQASDALQDLFERAGAWLSESSAGEQEHDHDHDLATGDTGDGCPPQSPDPCKGYRRQIKEHRRKLREYIEDPLGHDNRGYLRDALNSGQLGRAEDVYVKRIHGLRQQINNFENLLRKCEEMNGL